MDNLDLGLAMSRAEAFVGFHLPDENGSGNAWGCTCSDGMAYMYPSRHASTSHHQALACQAFVLPTPTYPGARRAQLKPEAHLTAVNDNATHVVLVLGIHVGSYGLPFLPTRQPGHWMDELRAGSDDSLADEVAI